MKTQIVLFLTILFVGSVAFAKEGEKEYRISVHLDFVAVSSVAPIIQKIAEEESTPIEMEIDERTNSLTVNSSASVIRALISLCENIDKKP